MSNNLPTTAAPTLVKCPRIALLYAPAERYLLFIFASKPPAVSTWQFSRPVAWSKAWDWGRSFLGVVGSNIALGTIICPLCLLCLIGYSPLRRSDPLSSGEYWGVFVHVCDSVLLLTCTIGSVSSLAFTPSHRYCWRLSIRHCSSRTNKH